jgi:hypothetical protein
LDGAQVLGQVHHSILFLLGGGYAVWRLPTARGFNNE